MATVTRRDVAAIRTLTLIWQLQVRKDHIGCTIVWIERIDCDRKSSKSMIGKRVMADGWMGLNTWA